MNVHCLCLFFWKENEKNCGWAALNAHERIKNILLKYKLIFARTWREAWPYFGRNQYRWIFTSGTCIKYLYVGTRYYPANFFATSLSKQCFKIKISWHFEDFWKIFFWIKNINFTQTYNPMKILNISEVKIPMKPWSCLK